MVTLAASCEAAGVHRQTGRNWRQAAGGLTLRHRLLPWGRYLSLEERLQIADLCQGGAGVRAIGVGIGRTPATVSRELRRHGSEPRPPATVPSVDDSGLASVPLRDPPRRRFLHRLGRQRPPQHGAGGADGADAPQLAQLPELAAGHVDDVPVSYTHLTLPTNREV